MTREKGYKGNSFYPLPKKVSDSSLADIRVKQKNAKNVRATSDRLIYETKLGVIPPQIRFDYSDNVFSFRGDWEDRFKVVKLFFPFIVSKKKCKKFEELVSKAFETVFLVKTKKEKKEE